MRPRHEAAEYLAAETEALAEAEFLQ